MDVFISASSLKDFLQCSEKVYFRINNPESAVQTTEMAIGTAVHSVIENGLDFGTGVTHAEYLLLEKGIEDLDAMKLVKKCLKNYFDNFQYLVSEQDEVEKFFRFKLEPGIYLTGKLDRVAIDKTTVIDWKTGAMYPLTIDNDPQFIIYYYAFTRLYGKQPANTFYVSLAHNKIIRYNYNKEIVDELFNKVIPKMVNVIRNKAFAKEGVFSFNGNMCKKCSYNGICQDKGELE